jgi:putative membrane protein
VEQVETQDTPRARLIIVVLSFVVSFLALFAVYAGPGNVEHQNPAPGGLASLNAVLNGLCAVLLTIGYFAIRARRIALHRASMIGAVVVSVAFLVTYLMHHFQVGSITFQGVGWIRGLYFGLLVPHIVLAAVVAPMALFTLYRAITGRFAAHKKVARLTLPLWLFVSVSGVLVYFLLYHA